MNRPTSIMFRATISMTVRITGKLCTRTVEPSEALTFGQSKTILVNSVLLTNACRARVMFRTVGTKVPGKARC